MPSHTQGIGLFTAENIVAVLGAIPETNGTYAAVAAPAQDYGGTMAPDPLSSWASTGQANIRALEIIERTCECGNDKMLLEDETLADQCRKCQAIDGQGRGHRRAR